MTEYDDLPTIATMMLWSLLSAVRVAAVLVIWYAVAVLLHAMEVF